MNHKAWEKMTAKMAQKNAPASHQKYGSARSVQLLAGTKSSVSMGMAAVVSRDGYALTAGHVAEELPVSVLKLKKKTPSASVATASATTTVGQVGELRDDSAYVGILGQPGKSKLNSNQSGQSLVRSPARVVRRFPGLDLALVKLPLATSHWFPLAKEMPKDNQPLYVTRNPVNHGGPTTLEGLAQQPEPVRNSKGSAWWVDSNVPVVPGDSGGAVFDEEGRLVGCVALGNIWRIVSADTRSTANRWTSIMGVTGEEIERTIAADRQRFEKNMKKLQADPTLQAYFDELIPKALPKRTEAVPVSGLTEAQVMERLMEARDRQKGFLW